MLNKIVRKVQKTQESLAQQNTSHHELVPKFPKL